MKPSFRNMGVVQSRAMAGSLLFEDESAQRRDLPYPDRCVPEEKFNPEWVTLELDVGSVLGFADLWEKTIVERMTVALTDVGRICKDQWQWWTAERTINEQVKFSQLTSRKILPEDDKLVMAPTDHRRFLTFNFASRDDAMLVRMTIVDLRSVKNADGGGMPQEP